MKHAILIMAHNNWEVLKCLLHQLDIPEFDIYLHINAKVQNYPKEKLMSCVKHATLQFVPRVSIGYYDYSMVKAVISLFRTATTTYHDYYHLISGVDMLIKQHKAFLSFFEQNQGMEFVGFWKTYSAERVLYRNYFLALGRQVSQFWSKVFIKFRKWLISFQRFFGLKKYFPQEWTPRIGPDWYSITHQAALCILKKEPEFRHYFYRTFCPTEFLPHTILGNSTEFKGKFYSPEKDEVIQSARTIDWKRGQPYVFKSEDFDSIVNSPGMFARKFDEHTDMAVVEKLCKYICNNIK